MPIFEISYLRNALHNLVEMWGTDGEGMSTTNIVGFCKGIMELRMHKNCTIVLPGNILTLWCACLLGCMTHYCVSW